MADIIGGITPPFLGTNNLITGTTDSDNIFGDPYLTDNFEGLSDPNDLGILSSGRGGNDTLDGAGGADIIVGDAGRIEGDARGGNDIIFGGDGDDFYLVGDSDNDMSGDARGG